MVVWRGDIYIYCDGGVGNCGEDKAHRQHPPSQLFNRVSKFNMIAIKASVSPPEMRGFRMYHICTIYDICATYMYHICTIYALHSICVRHMHHICTTYASYSIYVRHMYHICTIYVPYMCHIRCMTYARSCCPYLLIARVSGCLLFRAAGCCSQRSSPPRHHTPPHSTTHHSTPSHLL